MKNPFKQAWGAFQYWRTFRKYPGVFALSDAFLQINRILVPGRLNDAHAARELDRYLQVFVNAEGEGVSRIHCSSIEIDFFWNAPVDNNMFFMVEQELNAKNPHCYTTDPIKLDQTGCIIDVGACEGLFAFRMTKQHPNAIIHCFEPFGEMADLIRKGSEFNRVKDQIKVHTIAVGASEGHVKFVASDSPDAGAVSPCSESDQDALKATTLDHFAAKNGLELTCHDLIKIDAEGADLDVLKGSEKIIRRYRPQIAVTTYHKDEHPEEIYTWLNDLDLGYRFRLKGFSFWTEKPRPVLLQASTLDRAQVNI